MFSPLQQQQQQQQSQRLPTHGHVVFGAKPAGSQWTSVNWKSFLSLPHGAPSDGSPDATADADAHAHAATVAVFVVELDGKWNDMISALTKATTSNSDPHPGPAPGAAAAATTTTTTTTTTSATTNATTASSGLDELLAQLKDEMTLLSSRLAADGLAAAPAFVPHEELDAIAKIAHGAFLLNELNVIHVVSKAHFLAAAFAKKASIALARILAHHYPRLCRSSGSDSLPPPAAVHTTLAEAIARLPKTPAGNPEPHIIKSLIDAVAAQPSSAHFFPLFSTAADAPDAVAAAAAATAMPASAPKYTALLSGKIPLEDFASYIAACLNARRVEIWGSHHGLFTVMHPDLKPSARLLRFVEYAEAKEVCIAQSSICSPSCIDLLTVHGTPLYIFNIFNRSVASPSSPSHYLPGTIVGRSFISPASHLQPQAASASPASSFSASSASPLFAPDLSARFAAASAASTVVKAISVQRNITLLSMETIDMLRAAGFLSRVFSCFEKCGISIDLIATSETNVTVSLEPISTTLSHASSAALSSGSNLADAEALRVSTVMRELSRYCTVSSISPCAMFTLIGKNIGNCIQRLGLSVLQGKKIHVISKSANDVNFSFVVDELDCEAIETALHQYLILSDANSRAAGDVFGPSFSALERAGGDIAAAASTHLDEILSDSNDAAVAVSKEGGLFQGTSASSLLGFKQQRSGPSLSPFSSHTHPQWWMNSINELVSVAPPNEPLYVYSEECVRASIAKLQQLRAIGRFFYAMKANSHPALLETIVSHGFGLECVSIGELELARRVIGARNASARGGGGGSSSGAEIFFTPNFVQREEYETALNTGSNIIVNVDSMYPLRHWTSVFSGHTIMLRIDPGVGVGHHDHVKTGGSASKFGISQTDLAECAALCAENNISVVGLHCHAGSGILDPHQWVLHAELLGSLAQTHFPKASILNLGGGVGVDPECPESDVFNFTVLNALLEDFKVRFPRYSLWMEPGRFVVAASGVLLCRVSQIKRKSGVTFVGVNAGMHSLIRPALYNAFHGIYNISRWFDVRDDTMTCTVVGPICESGDVLGRDRLLPASTGENDVMLVECTGAYGRSMSSTYNLRPLAQEIVFRK